MIFSCPQEQLKNLYKKRESLVCTLVIVVYLQTEEMALMVHLVHKAPKEVQEQGESRGKWEDQVQEVCQEKVE